MPDNLVTVHTTHADWEAQMIKGYLEAAEIPVHLDFEAAGRVFGITVDGLGEIRLQVLPADEEQARRLVEEYSAPQSED